MANKGYILLHRKLLDSNVWDDGEKHNRKSAWIDLLLIANHADKEKTVDGKIITIHRGQCFRSIRSLADRWGVHHTTAKKWLIVWRNAGMIYLDITHRYTLISIVNYAYYQDGKAFQSENYRHTIEQSIDQSIDQSTTSDYTQTKNVKECIKNDRKNEKEIKSAQIYEIEPPTGGGEWQ